MPADATAPPPSKAAAGHIRLTSHSAGTAAPAIRWGATTAVLRGPVVGTTGNRSHRNVIGTHSGAYGVYRALAVAGSGEVEIHASDHAFAAIDVNLACPVKKIAKKSRGGHWLTQPEGAIRILEAVREATPADIAVTVKMRRAYDETDEMRENFLRIFDSAYDIGCAWVTVHGRTVTQKYMGPSRWDPIRGLVRRNPERVIFGSGDVWNVSEIFRMLDYAGVAGVSVARGCIGNPWIFRQARDILAGRAPQAPSIEQQRDVLLQHFQLAMDVNRLWVRGEGEAREERAERHTARTMRKFAIKFADHHPETLAVRKRFIACKTMQEWRGVLDEHYNAEVTAS